MLTVRGLSNRKSTPQQFAEHNRCRQWNAAMPTQQPGMRFHTKFERRKTSIAKRQAEYSQSRPLGSVPVAAATG
jgi:hypothetical protein